MMKRIVFAITILVLSGVSQAGYINGINWADRVVSHTDKIQSWADGYCGGPGAQLMQLETPSTAWWVLGPWDADGNGNMYAWDFDDGDHDFVGGWRTGSSAHMNQEILVEFDTGIRDVEGDDIMIRVFCGPVASASVWASTDGSDFVNLGIIDGRLNQIPGSPGYLYDARFDFDARFVEEVHYISVFREVTQPQSGMFFDSFGSACVDLPTNRQEVAEFGWTMDADINRDCYVNLEDFIDFSGQWQLCNDPALLNDPNENYFDISLFDDPNDIPSSCHGVWQAGMGLSSDINHDCMVDLEDLEIYADSFLNCNNPEDPNCVITW